MTHGYLYKCTNQCLQNRTSHSTTLCMNPTSPLNLYTLSNSIYVSLTHFFWYIKHCTIISSENKQSNFSSNFYHSDTNSTLL